MTWQGLFVIATFSLNSVTFTLGIVETSASVVLTAVATMPVFAAILSAFLLQERQGWRGWAAIFTAMAAEQVRFGFEHVVAAEDMEIDDLQEAWD